MSVCIWFIYLLMRLAFVRLVLYMIKMLCRKFVLYVYRPNVVETQWAVLHQELHKPDVHLSHDTNNN